MLLDRYITAGNHIVHLTIDQSNAGWDVCEELDSATVHVEHHDDWHRVERAMDRLEREVRHGVFAVTAHH